MSRLARKLLCIALCAAAGCSGREPRTQDVHAPADSTAPVREFAESIARLTLDSTRFELRGTLAVKRVNPNKDDESPLSDEWISGGAAPGPHTYDGTFYADLQTLRGILDPKGSVRHDVEEDRVYVGSPEILILGHRHGDALFVPVKLYARQFRAFVDVRGTMGTTAIIWTTQILSYSRKIGLLQSAGLVQGYAEGLVESLDVRAKPGW